VTEIPTALNTIKNMKKTTTVRFKNPANIDDFQYLAFVGWVEVEQEPVKWAFSQKA